MGNARELEAPSDTEFFRRDWHRTGTLRRLGALTWLGSKPKPPKPWNSAAIVARNSPSFNPGKTNREIQLSYSLENTTEADYQIDSDAHLKIMLRTAEGTFSQPIPADAAFVKLPIFIPPKQTAFVELTLLIPGVPERNAKDTDEEYHERLRAFLQDHLSGVAESLPDKSTEMAGRKTKEGITCFSEIKSFSGIYC